MRILKFHSIVLALALFTAGCKSTDNAYLFTSFHEPATEGLRLLYSYDGYRGPTLAARSLHLPSAARSCATPR